MCYIFFGFGIFMLILMFDLHNMLYHIVLFHLSLFKAQQFYAAMYDYLSNMLYDILC